MKTITNLSAKLLRSGLGLGLCLFSVSFAQAQNTITWTGAVDATYSKPDNWNLRRVPNSQDNVVIPSATVVSTQPILDASLGIGVAGNLTINTGASLTLNPQSELDLFGNMINNGTFNGQGTLSIRTGTAPHFITSANGSNNTANTIAIRDLELLAGSQTFLSLPITLQRALTLNADLNISTNGSLTLLSTANVTAFVVNNGTSVVNGLVTVQRAIDTSVNGSLGYRHYSTPVNGNVVSDFTTAGFSPTLTTSYNESSFAPGTRPFPTVFLYDQSRVATDNGYSPANGYSAFDRGWFVPSSPSSPLLVGRGYTVNIAGNQLVDFVGTLNNAPSTPISVPFARNAAGTNSAVDAGWVLLGNPFPSAIDYSRVDAADRTGLDNSMYVYTSTSQYGGYYRAYNFASGGAAANGNPVIPVGQAFFVHVTNPGVSGTFNFRNSQRLTTSDGTTFQRSAADVRPQLEMALHSSDKVVQDMLNVYFQAGSTAGTDSEYDAVKPANNNGMMLNTLAADGQALAIDSRPLPTSELTIPLSLSVAATGSYTLETAKLANMNGLHAYLRDKKLGSVVDLAQQPNYTFNLSANNATPRFELVFSARAIETVAPAALAQQVELYPSPAKDVAFVELPTNLGSEAVKATLVDALGRTVRTTNLEAQGEATHQLNLSGLNKGIYTLRLNTSAGVVAKRLVIE